jgi:hypothetical protein
MSAFLSVDLLTDFAAFCLTDFIDWRYIHSWFVFSTQLVNCFPHGRRNYTCVLLPLYCTFSLTSSPLPPSQWTVYTDNAWLWGGGCWNVLWTIFCKEFYILFLTRFRTYKIASPPQTKMTSKDDITGLVSIKFLRPWGLHNSAVSVHACSLSVRKLKVPNIRDGWQTNCQNIIHKAMFLRVHICAAYKYLRPTKVVKARRPPIFQLH